MTEFLIVLLIFVAMIVAVLAVQARALMGLVSQISRLRDDVVIAQVVRLPEKMVVDPSPLFGLANRKVSDTAQPEASE